MHNLMKIRLQGILCPEVVALKKHVLIMSFVGKDEKPAPKLKDAILTPDEWTIAYKQTYQVFNLFYFNKN